MKKVKRILSLAVIGIIALGLIGCGEKTTENNKKITIGVCPGPYGDMVNDAIAPYLKNKGYEVTVTEFTDYIQPDQALANREINANLMQHTEYLNKFSKDNNLELSAIKTVPTLSMGAFSSKYKSIGDIPNGAKVAVPDDVSNLARALKVLRNNGLIELANGVDETKVSLKDISSNKKKLKFIEVEGPQLPRSIDSVDLSMVPGNFAYASGFDYSTALFTEKLTENYKNVIAVRTEDLDSELGKDLKEVVESDEYREVIESGKYKEFDKPEWWD